MRRRKFTLQFSTVRRYFDALATFAATVDPQTDLLDADEETVTDLYAALLFGAQLSADTAKQDDGLAVETAHHATCAQDTAIGPVPLQKRSIAPDAQTTDARDVEYVLARLEEFHRFASATYGVEDPDWSELSTDQSGPSGRPGLVTIAEYLLCLQYLCSVGLPQMDDDALASAWLLLLGARFGLRISEAVGLLRSDWVDAAETVVVLVRRNRLRGLKRAASRRQVPLVEPLTEAESKLIKEVMRRWESWAKPSLDEPILVQLHTEELRTVRARLSQLVNALLKDATCCGRITFHHLRHALANRALLGLLAKRSPIRDEHASPEHWQKLLLCQRGTDRRVLWAVARLLGHASPAATLKSYVHVLDLITPSIAYAHPEGGALGRDVAPMSSVKLDAAPRHVHYLEHIALPPRPVVNTGVATRVCVYLRLRSLGQHPSVAETRALLSPGHSQQIEILREQINSQIFGNSQGSTASDHRKDDLLTKIRPSRWGVLVGLSACIQDGFLAAAPDHAIQMFTRRHQLALFEPGHFQLLSKLQSAINLEPNELRLWAKRGLHSKVGGWIENSGLLRNLNPTEIETGQRPFQLAYVSIGDVPRKVIHLATATVSGAGKLETTYELCALIFVILASALI